MPGSDSLDFLTPNELFFQHFLVEAVLTAVNANKYFPIFYSSLFYSLRSIQKAPDKLEINREYYFNPEDKKA